MVEIRPRYRVERAPVEFHHRALFRRVIDGDHVARLEVGAFVEAPEEFRELAAELLLLLGAEIVVDVILHRGAELFLVHRADHGDFDPLRVAFRSHDLFRIAHDLVQIKPDFVDLESPDAARGLAVEHQPVSLLGRSRDRRSFLLGARAANKDQGRNKSVEQPHGTKIC